MPDFLHGSDFDSNSISSSAHHWTHQVFVLLWIPCQKLNWTGLEIDDRLADPLTITPSRISCFRCFRSLFDDFREPVCVSSILPSNWANIVPPQTSLVYYPIEQTSILAKIVFKSKLQFESKNGVKTFLNQCSSYSL